MLLGAHPEGASVVDDDGMCPVAIAIASHYPATNIRALMQLADGAPTTRRKNLLHWTFSSGSRQLKQDVNFVQELILREGPTALADPDPAGQLVLHSLCQADLPQSAEDWSSGTGVARLILERSPRTASSTADGTGRIPLHYAACGTSIGIVDALLARNPRGPAALDHSGRLPLHYAAENSNSVDVVVAVLRGNEATASVFDKAGVCPLFDAMMRNTDAGRDIARVLKELSPRVSCDAPWRVRSKIVTAMMKADESERRWDEDECEYMIDRADYFDSAVAAAAIAADEEQLAATPKIRFEGEDGDDYGGLSRDFWREIAEVFLQQAGLFRANHAGALQPVATVVADAVYGPEKAASLYRSCGTL